MGQAGNDFDRTTRTEHLSMIPLTDSIGRLIPTSTLSLRNHKRAHRLHNIGEANCFETTRNHNSGHLVQGRQPRGPYQLLRGRIFSDEGNPSNPKITRARDKFVNRME